MAEPTKDELREFLRWVDALLRSIELSIRTEDSASLWKHSGYRSFLRKYQQLLEAIAPRVSLPPILDHYDLAKIPGNGDTLPFQRKELFDSVHANVSLLKSLLESRIGIVEDETAALRDFLQARLRAGIFTAPQKEREIQDALELLLIGRGMQKGQDYDREVGRVKVSAKEVIPDFIVPKLGLALEVKLVTDSPRRSSAIDEINADILAYAKRYRSIVFLVYDLGFIRDETEFRHDLEKAPGVFVLVVKH